MLCSLNLVDGSLPSFNQCKKRIAVGFEFSNRWHQVLLEAEKWISSATKCNNASKQIMGQSNIPFSFPISSIYQDPQTTDFILHTTYTTQDSSLTSFVLMLLNIQCHHLPLHLISCSPIYKKVSFGGCNSIQIHHNSCMESLVFNECHVFK